jgi:hypothetical protein
MHFSSTDLPVPDPPMMTIDVPEATSGHPRSTWLAPKALWTPRSSIMR